MSGPRGENARNLNDRAARDKRTAPDGGCPRAQPLAKPFASVVLIAPDARRA
jgi:hypothetical protein